eukprot:Clim_evm33s215 gene=Clim_evmTU33s215
MMIVTADATHPAALPGICPHMTAAGPYQTLPHELRSRIRTLTHVLVGQHDGSKGAVLSCGEPGCSRSGHRILVCAECNYKACTGHNQNTDDSHHMQMHLESAGHGFAVSLCHDVVYCCICKDSFYDEFLSRYAHTETVRAGRQRSKRSRSCPRAEDFLLPDDEIPAAKVVKTVVDVEENLISKGESSHGSTSGLDLSAELGVTPVDKKSSKKLDESFTDSNRSGGNDSSHAVDVLLPRWHRLDSAARLGLRGLVNLGNTCFMSSILQVLIHTPMMRNYFLSDSHPQVKCMWVEKHGTTHCLCCEMDHLVRSFYSGETNPFSPHSFLSATWHCVNHLAGYAQQDAHELLIAVLDTMHRHSGGTNQDCKCIIHRIFTGILQSDVTCLACGHVRVTMDPFWDISLNVKDPLTVESGSKKGHLGLTLKRSGSNRKGKKGSLTKSHSTTNLGTALTPNSADSNGVIKSEESNPEDNASAGVIPPANGNDAPPVISVTAALPAAPRGKADALDLRVCLERFTSNESLGDDIYCQKCLQQQPAAKQLSLYSLPVMLCLHLKRFEHSTISRKLDRPVSFPMELDMSAFVSFSKTDVDKTTDISAMDDKSMHDYAVDQVMNGMVKKEDQNGDRRDDPARQNGVEAGEGDEQRGTTSAAMNAKGDDAEYKYELMGVVNHHGVIDRGHYTNYIRRDQDWYRCDDAYIYRATADEVLRSEGYLLFYMKSNLIY